MIDFDAILRKQQRRELRRDRVEAREAAWVADYEAKQATALGDPYYQLPNGKHRETFGGQSLLAPPGITTTPAE